MIVILIGGILIATSIVVGAKQIANARIQEVTAFLQTVDRDIEDGTLEFGFIPSECFLDGTKQPTKAAVSAHGETIKALLHQLEDMYLSCTLNYDTLRYIEGAEAVSLDGGGGTTRTYAGFSLDLVDTDAWGQHYSMYYMYTPFDDGLYRIVIASMGPNSRASQASETGYLSDTPDESGRWEDDVILVMTSRNIFSD